MPVKTFKANLYDVRAGDSEEPLSDDSLQAAIKGSREMGLAERSLAINDKVADEHRTVGATLRSMRPWTSFCGKWWSASGKIDLKVQQFPIALTLRCYSLASAQH